MVKLILWPNALSAPQLSVADDDQIVGDADSPNPFGKRQPT